MCEKGDRGVPKGGGWMRRLKGGVFSVVVVVGLECLVVVDPICEVVGIFQCSC